MTTYIEQLESRRLLDAVLQSDGTLMVTGTAGQDYMMLDGVRGISTTSDGVTHVSLLVQSFEHVAIDDGQGNVRSTYPLRFQESFDTALVTRIEVHGGAGNDVIRLNAAIPAQIFGEDGYDAISAWGSDHVLFGGDGRDILVSGDGNDSLYGGASPDELFSHGGNDLMSGGGGGDILHGYAGRDRIYGGPGSDLIYGEEGSDKLFGGEGDDTIFGNSGNDSLDGGAGADHLHGTTGDDHFVADDGEADTLEGGGGMNVGLFDDPLDNISGVDVDPLAT